MDYEKGAPRNLVQFSEYNDLAFTDTGVSVNDNSKPSRNVIWSSDRVERRINEALGGSGQVAASGSGMGVGGSLNVRFPMMQGEHEYYPNGYRRYLSRNGRKFKFFRVLRPSWWLSFIIPSRQHYCDKCCNYLDHTWSTVWNDDPKLSNTRCESGKCSGSKQIMPPPSRK
ncbi:hypothetical protein [Dasineura jujubifolia toursvirus 2a]|nr:hypothetical protein [Dasineura jujubifolia toursvirus 2a]